MESIGTQKTTHYYERFFVLKEKIRRQNNQRIFTSLSNSIPNLLYTELIISEDKS